MTHEHSAPRDRRRRSSILFLRLFGTAATLAGLAACAGPGPQIPATQEAAQYRAHARNYYQAPGPSWDPWGPYIKEASQRFDVPESWIRAVMHQESGGQEFVVSAPGAMGLMQVMPFTYDLMREQYALGDDPYDPHNNVLAGTAYIRQMYDIYGSPGFLAAYNAGPGRLDDFLTRNRPLPAETRHYVAAIGPQIAFDSPRSRSQADLMAMNHAGGDAQFARNAPSPTNPALTHSVELAWARRAGRATGASEEGNEDAAFAPSIDTRNMAVASLGAPDASAVRAAWSRRAPQATAMQVASAAPVRPAEQFLPAPTPAQPTVAAVPVVTAAPPMQLASARLTSAPSAELADSVAEAPDNAPAPGRGRVRFRLVNSAMAETVPWHSAGARGVVTTGAWAIQVGAFGSAGAATAAAGSARAQAAPLLGHAHAEIASVHERRGKLFRARLTGLSREAAEKACAHLHRSACVVVSPDSQS